MSVKHLNRVGTVLKSSSDLDAPMMISSNVFSFTVNIKGEPKKLSVIVSYASLIARLWISADRVIEAALSGNVEVNGVVVGGDVDIFGDKRITIREW